MTAALVLALALAVVCGLAVICGLLADHTTFGSGLAAAVRGHIPTSEES